MSEFYEKLKQYLAEDNFKDATPKDFKDINKNPEARTIKKEENDILNNTKTLEDFIALVNPATGEINKNCVFKYVNEFRRRNKDILIMTPQTDKTLSSPDVVKFYAVDRENFASFIATIMENEESMKELKSKIAKVYTTEQTELALEDYIDMVIKGKISIITNPGDEMDIEEITSPQIYKVQKEKKEKTDKVDLKENASTKFYAKKMLEVFGGTISGFAVDQADEFFGLRITMPRGNKVKTIWFLRDEEGNGPGAFEID